MFYYLRWVYQNGIKKIEQLNAELVVYGKQILQIEVNNSIRILGVYMTPTLNWKSQFEIMRKKINNSITKLI